MVHLWTVATWELEITPDAGYAEWIGAPLTELTFDLWSPHDDYIMDDGVWSIPLPDTLFVYSAWHMDEVCNGLYLTCLDPRGKTIHQQLIPNDLQIDPPRVVRSSVPLTHVWYTVDGYYTFTLAHCYDGLPYLPSSSIRILLMQGYE